MWKWTCTHDHSWARCKAESEPISGQIQSIFLYWEGNLSFVDDLSTVICFDSKIKASFDSIKKCIRVSTQLIYAFIKTLFSLQQVDDRWGRVKLNWNLFVNWISAALSLIAFVSSWQFNFASHTGKNARISDINSDIKRSSRRRLNEPNTDVSNNLSKL